ncbi:N-acetylmuramoyl-L-alanine amidase [Agaribacterium haliotis]|uniref:N-acetylmuramoyl-L-alanine amidase n=1 Tax=Agaribacterium haliotis TaxID=2013869 RepID=UPI001EFC9EDE|nr:N-acetylmuramoyl-L-alanine amidase [Agaribacterium haliotis]
MKRVRISLSFIYLSLLCLLSAELFAATVEGVRLWRSPDSTRLVFDLDGPVDHKLFKLSGPERLVIDLKNSRFDAKTKDLKLADTPVKKLRYGGQKGGDLRIVLDLKHSVKPRSFALKRIDDKPDRLVVDLYNRQQQTEKSVEALLPAKSQRGKRDVVIAIDAGHGGEDPGAIGPGRLYEKTVVLKVAKNLANTINKEPGYKAVLVREGDYFIPLHKRPEKARAAHADLFVSIHADGFDNPKARGASVFTLSRRGASSKMASILASKENKSDLIGGVDRIQLGDKEEQLKKILVDLSMTSSMEASMDVGKRVLNEMGKVTHLHSKRVESAGFAVLKSADVPSILVETGFITNPSEAKNLNSLAHRTKLSKAIFKGINAYFQNRPPEGSFLAWKKQGRGTNYTIASGDTLSSIAQRYNVSVASIKKANQLNSSTIKVGQTLAIPTL